MKPYGFFDNPFEIRKSGGWPRKAHKPRNQNAAGERATYRWFKRIARRFGKQQIEEQQI